MSKYEILGKGFSHEDIMGAVAVHRQEIGQGFLSSMGNQALALIFSLAADSRWCKLLIVKDKETGLVCGFLLGTIRTTFFYKEFLLRKSAIASITLIPKMLSLSRIRKVFETLLYPSKKEVQGLPPAELLDIAVSKGHDGIGLAQVLFCEFSKFLQEKGIGEFKITTGENLLRAQRFYEKLGAKRIGVIEVHKGQKTIVYTYSIPG